MNESIFINKKVKLGFLITQNCNFKCKHCLSGCPFDEELSLEQYIKILDIFADKIEFVSFSGGEPILHSHFKEIIAETAKREIPFTLVSNAFFYEKYAFLLAYKNLISSLTFSLDGLKETHDRNRKKHSFEKVMEAIDFYQDKGFKVKINYTISKQGFNEVEDVLEMLANKKVDTVNLGAVIKNDTNQDMALSIEERARIYWKALEYAKLYPDMNILSSTTLYIARDVEICANFGNQNWMYFNQNGKFTFCCNIADPYGSLGKVEENNLPALIAKKEYMKMKMREDRIAKRLSGKLSEMEVRTCEYCNNFFKN